MKVERVALSGAVNRFGTWRKEDVRVYIEDGIAVFSPIDSSEPPFVKVSVDDLRKLVDAVREVGSE